MATPTTTITEQITFAGPLAGRGVVIGAVVLVVLLLVALWSDFRMGRPLLAACFALLRGAAIALLLWMLAGPQKVITTRQETPRSVLLMIDASASMGVIDPPEIRLPQQLRWDAVAQDTPWARRQTVLDEAAARLSAVRQLLTQTQGYERAITTLTAAARQLDGPALSLRQDIERQALPFLRGVSTGATPPAELDLLLAQLQSRAVALADAHTLEAPPSADANHTRLQRVSHYLDRANHDWLQRLRAQANVKAYRFAGAAAPADADDWQRLQDSTGWNAQATDLTRPLQQMNQDAAAGPVAMTVWLTDGAHNQGQDPRLAAAANAPAQDADTAASDTALPGVTYIVPIGNTRAVRDLVVHHVSAPRSIFTDDVLIVDATLYAYDAPNESLHVQLRQDDKIVAETTLQTPSESAGVSGGNSGGESGGTSVLRLRLQHKVQDVGLHKYHLQVTPIAAEQTLENNVANFDVDVTEGQIRVLLVDAAPRWEYRYLANLFRRDERVQHAAVLLESEGKAGQAPQLPQQLDDWSRFRVVIMGDVPPQRLTAMHQQQLRDYVMDRGGTLVLIAGDSAMPQAYVDGPLGALIPVQAPPTVATAAAGPASGGAGFIPYLTDEGRSLAALRLADDSAASAQLWEQAFSRNPIFDLSRLATPRATARTLLGVVPGNAVGSSSAPPRSLLCWHDVGRGRVVYLAAPFTYRLRYRRGDELHHRFWAQLLRWAVARELDAGSRAVRITTDKTVYRQDEPPQVSVRLTRVQDATAVRFGNVEVIVLDEQGKQSSVALAEDEKTPGTYHARLEDLPVGQVRLQAGGRTVQDLLKAETHQSAVQTVVTIEAATPLELRDTRCNLPLLQAIAQATGGAVVPPTALPALLESVDLSPQVSQSMQTTPLWNRWLFVWIFVGCLLLEWTMRKLAGLA